MTGKIIDFLLSLSQFMAAVLLTIVIMACVMLTLAIIGKLFWRAFSKITKGEKNEP